MKEFEITELMREYTDDEFNIEGENAADTEKVVESVMGQVKPKKRMKPLFKVLIAAAVAACLMGATVTTGIYFTATDGTEYGFYTDEDGLTHWKIEEPSENRMDKIIRLEDGRLYFVADGGKTDITDLIDEETPYIYKLHDLPTDKEYSENYILVGGTPEKYGYASFTLSVTAEHNPGKCALWSASVALNSYYEERNDLKWYVNGVEQLKSEGRLVGYVL